MSATARFNAWASQDDNDLGQWLRHPVETARWHLADALSGLGGALARLAHRIHDDAPGDYSDGYVDGEWIAGLYAATTTPMPRDDAVRLLERLGVDLGPDTLAKLGLMGEEVEESKARARDAFDERQGQRHA